MVLTFGAWAVFSIGFLLGCAWASAKALDRAAEAALRTHRRSERDVEFNGFEGASRVAAEPVADGDDFVALHARYPRLTIAQLETIMERRDQERRRGR